MPVSLDSLSPTSREFYELSLFKTIVSVIYFSIALFYIGMCARAGGLSRNAHYLGSNANDDNVEDTYKAEEIGYGFASFFYFCAFVVILGAAFHILPAVGGSHKEAKTLFTPLEITDDGINSNPTVNNTPYQPASAPPVAQPVKATPVHDKDNTSTV